MVADNPNCPIPPRVEPGVQRTDTEMPEHIMHHRKGVPNKEIRQNEKVKEMNDRIDKRYGLPTVEELLAKEESEKDMPATNHIDQFLSLIRPLLIDQYAKGFSDGFSDGFKQANLAKGDRE